MRSILTIALGLVLFAPASAQRDIPGDEQAGSGFSLDTALPFSAEGQGVLGAGLFGPTQDPVRAIENPAFLADLGDGLRVAGTQTSGLNGLDGLDLRTGAVSGGSAWTLAGRPLTVGVGLSLSDVSSFDPTGESSNSVIGGGVGAGWDGPVRVRAGVGLRRLASSGTSFDLEGTPTGTVSQSALAADLGADVTLPVGAWVQSDWDEGLRIVFDVSVGGALRGLTLATDADPAPGEGGFTPTVDRSPAVGGRALLGVGLGTRARPLLGLALEGLADNVELLDDEVELRGGRLVLLEAVTLRAGSLNGGSFLPRTTTGLGLSVGGLLRAVGTFTDDPGLYDLGRRVDVRLDVADQTFEDDADGIFGGARTVGFSVFYRP